MSFINLSIIYGMFDLNNMISNSMFFFYSIHKRLFFFIQFCISDGRQLDHLLRCPVVIDNKSNT